MPTIKNILNAIFPPLLSSFVKKVLYHKKYNPKWVELDYEPVKGLKMFFDPTGSWQKKMVSNTYDLYLFQKLDKENIRGKVVYDIGAHIGFHSFYFAKLVGKGGAVYAFEPNKTNVERIKIILENNKDISDVVSVYNVAISNKIGKESFILNKNIENGRSSGGFINSSDTFWNRDVYETKGFVKEVVDTVPIDSFRQNLDIHKLPDIIKIDVEGAEYLVLLGGKETLLSKGPTLFMEIHSILNMYNVLYFLNSISYNFSLLNSEPNGPVFIEARPRKQNDNSHSNNI